VTFSEQATLQAQLDRVLTEIARVEWKLALEEMVQRWLGDDDSSTESPGRPAIDESKSAARTECERLNLELGELRSESIRITALMPVSLPRATAIRLIRKPG
jgi:hypothetical protein